MVPVDPAVIGEMASSELAGTVQPGSPAVAGEVAATAAPVATPGPTCAPPPPDARPAALAYRGSTARKVVALTFDDGQDAANTQRILDALRQMGVMATFFPTGHAVEANPSGWRAIAAAGFPIANHTYAHRILAGRCYAAQLSDLTRQRAALRSAGITSFPVMRPPGGSWDRVTRLAAGAAGERAVVMWDIDTRDWAGASAWEIARSALAGREGSIILMHTFVANTAAALPSIISGYRARGFTFVTVGTMLGID